MTTLIDIQKKYQLRPNNHLQTFNTYDNVHHYGQLSDISRQAYIMENERPENTLKSHKTMFPKTLSKEGVDTFLRFVSEKDQYQRISSEILPLVKMILTPEIDKAVKGYFGSHYAVMWASFSEVKHPDTPRRYFTKWHCDGGPSCHLKTITYLNSTSDHESATLVAGEDATKRLKEVGYIMNDITKRQSDISDLTDHFDIDFDPERVEFEAGDTILFNPSQLAHRAEMPKDDAVRYSFTLCFVPSPIPWDALLDKGVSCRIGCQAFEDYALEVMRASDIQNLKQTITEIVELNEKAMITDTASLHHHLNIIFKDSDYAQRIYDNILKISGTKLNFSLHELIIKLKVSFQKDLNWQNYFTNEDLDNVRQLLDFEKRHVNSFARFRTNNKPNPNAIMWPIPNHPKHPNNKFDMLPYVNRHKIMNHNTPIGSAGSCFAFEIAEFLQAEGFNYVVEERADNPANGVFVDGYKAGDKYAKFSANYGLLFNTPSLKQLAEKAFGHRQFTRYCCVNDNNVYTDPYRENVYFSSKAAYLEDYENHIAAVRGSLLKSKVFVFTAGLNECWQLHDGSVISRNPRDGFYHLLSHRVLTVEENVANIKDFVNMVRVENPDFKLVISLSPVPLLATGRGNTHHIIEANTHSKAVLRVAIEQVVSEMEGVYYLPSYELVTECAQDAWKDDHRHVKREVVQRVISMFKEMFVE
ncbi:MAG: GSCFA domain-containing protein [Agarilytica sp.]